MKRTLEDNWITRLPHEEQVFLRALVRQGCQVRVHLRPVRQEGVLVEHVQVEVSQRGEVLSEQLRPQLESAFLAAYLESLPVLVSRARA